MDAAQQLQPPPNESQAGGDAATAGAAQGVPAPTIEQATLDAQGAEQAGAAPAVQAQAERHLTAVPLAPQDARPEPTRVLRRAQPKVEGPASAREEKQARGTETVSGEEGLPSKDQIRRYKTRLNKAETAAEKAEAIRYGAERGVPEAIELMNLLKGGDAPPKQDAQAPAGTSPAAQAAPAQGAQPQAAEQPKPEGPRYMGQTREALKRHSEAGAFIGNLAVGIGRLAGWEAPPEPMELFKGVPGFEPIKADGRPQERIAELVTLELAAQSAKGGAEDSPMRRRLELGLLVACTAGPGVFPFGWRLGSAGLEKLAKVGGVVSRMVRRVTRR